MKAERYSPPLQPCGAPELPAGPQHLQAPFTFGILRIAALLPEFSKSPFQWHLSAVRFWHDNSCSKLFLLVGDQLCMLWFLHRVLGAIENERHPNMQISQSQCDLRSRAESLQFCSRS